MVVPERCTLMPHIAITSLLGALVQHAQLAVTRMERLQGAAAHTHTRRSLLAEVLVRESIATSGVPHHLPKLHCLLVKTHTCLCKCWLVARLPLLNGALPCLLPPFPHLTQQGRLLAAAPAEGSWLIVSNNIVLPISSITHCQREGPRGVRHDSEGW